MSSLSEIGEGLKLMLMYNFPVIYQNIIVRSADQQHLNICIHYLETKTGEKLANLFQANRQVVLVELITMLEFSSARVMQALGCCAMVDNNFNHPEKKVGGVSKGVLAKYLAGRLPAVLVSYITSCSNLQVRTQDKLQCLKSLELF